MTRNSRTEGMASDRTVSWVMCSGRLTEVTFRVSLLAEPSKALLCMVPQPMELSGFEPLTPAMPLQCSTN